MKRRDFDEAVRDLKKGDRVCVTVRGNYGNFIVERVVESVEDGWVHYTTGFSNSYKRILGIRKVAKAEAHP